MLYNVAKNKDADQLHVDHTAYLLILSSNEQKAGFLVMQLICMCTKI